MPKQDDSMQEQDGRGWEHAGRTNTQHTVCPLRWQETHTYEYRKHIIWYIYINKLTIDTPFKSNLSVWVHVYMCYEITTIFYRLSTLVLTHAVTKNSQSQYNEWHLLHSQKTKHTYYKICVLKWTHYSHHTSILRPCSSSCKDRMMHLQRGVCGLCMSVWSLVWLVHDVKSHLFSVPDTLCVSIFFTHMRTHCHSLVYIFLSLFRISTSIFPSISVLSPLLSECPIPS